MADEVEMKDLTPVGGPHQTFEIPDWLAAMEKMRQAERERPERERQERIAARAKALEFAQDFARVISRLEGEGRSPVTEIVLIKIDAALARAKEGSI